MRGLIETYRLLLGEHGYITLAASATDKVLRAHIKHLLKEKGASMKTPQVLDAKRCCIDEELKTWYSDPEVKEAYNPRHDSGIRY